MLMPLVTLPAEAVDDMSSDIVVNGNAGFPSVVRSGTGTQQDPYIISDYNVSSANIQIKNTTSHLIIRNITFNSGSWTDRWGLYLYNADNVIIENVTSDGKLHFLYSYLSQYITVKKCHVNDIPSGNYVMEIVATSSMTVTECTFSKSAVSGGSTLYLNNQGINQKFTGCSFNGVSLRDESFHATGFLHNCTFSDSTVFLANGNTGGRITDNVFRSPGKTALQIQATYRLTITGNYFEANRGIYFTGCLLQWTNSDNGYLENNTFENCTVGIDTEFQTSNQPSRWIVKNNYFGNCTSYAINWQRGALNTIYRNIFYHNAGTDDSTSGYQVYQVDMFSYKNVWSETSGGNFWANHRTPDTDVNGIVDVEYTFPNSGTDYLPYTNPYFDTGRPSISLTVPRGGYSEKSYIRLKWDARDDLSGVGKVYLAVDKSEAEEITDLTERSVFLAEGDHLINLTVFDRAGLYVFNERMITLNTTVEVLSIETPVENEYYDDDPMRIMWSVRTGFPVTNQSLRIDDTIYYLNTVQRVYEESVDEGYHEITVSVTDDQNLSLEKTVGFYADRTPPVITVLSPQPGSVLSNPIVSFNFEATDNVKLSGMMIKIDDGEWEDALQYTTSSRFLKTGGHIFYAKAVDMAGLIAEISVRFTVGGPNGLNILSPYDGQYTSLSSIPFIWEYNGTFSYSEAIVRIGASSDFQPVNELPDGLVYLPYNGDFDIALRLVDEFENYIESIITVVKDDTTPSIVFLEPEQGKPSNERDLLIKWAGLDDWGVSSYSIMIDEEEPIDLGESTEYRVSLEEGTHTISVVATDRAGNMGENRIEITMDYTDPVIELLTPKNGSIFKDPRISFYWKAADDDEIEMLTLTVDDRDEVDLLETDRYTETFSRDSYHTAVLTAVDRAGNMVQATSIFLIDSTPPALLWGLGPGYVSPNNWVNISFMIIEEAGIRELNLSVDGRIFPVPISDDHINISLEDGRYDLALTCVDLAGHRETIESEYPLIVDTTPPNITISEETTVLNGKGVVYWLADGTGSDIQRIEIVVDGEDPVILDSGNTYSTGVLMPGSHAILIRAYDEAGNSGEALWTFEVEEEITDNGGGGGGGFGWIVAVAAGMAIFLLGLLILAFMMIRKRNADEGREQMIIEDAEAPQLSLAKMARNLPPTSGAAVSNLPPPKESDVEDRVDGTGYIRPVKIKEKGAPEVSRHRLRSDGRSIDHGKGDHETLELRGSGRKDIGTPWESERKRILEMEAEGVFVGQQISEDEDEMLKPPPPIPGQEDAEVDIPVWGDDSDEDYYEDGESDNEPADEGSVEPPVPEWEDVEFDEDQEDMEELEELEELEDLE
ncbi:MAG: right-handed parallel beta-helix repeat-containing protein [Thermoplasmatota archaeon]